MARFEVPQLDVPYESVALQHEREYQMNEGQILSSGSEHTAPLRIEVEEFSRHFAERQVPHSTALHSLRLPNETAYLTGPIARMNLCRDQLPARAAAAA